MMKRLFVMMTVAALCCVCCSAGIEGLKVGVFNPLLANGAGNSCEKIYAMLREDVELDVEYVSSVEKLSDYKAVIFSCVKSVGKQPDNWKEILRDYVKTGGGIILLHDSCGRMHSMSPPVFPEVAGSTVKLISNAGAAVVKKDASHPIMAGVKDFKLQLDQYPELVKGSQGKVLMETEKGVPVVLAGAFGKGCVVAIGSIPGWSDKDPDTPENKVLINSLYWAAKSDSGTASGGASGVGAGELRALKKEILSMRRRIEALEKQVENGQRNLRNMIRFSNSVRGN